MTEAAQRELIECVAQAIYADGYYDYGQCPDKAWQRTSETQREFMRHAAVAAIQAYAGWYARHVVRGA